MKTLIQNYSSGLSTEPLYFNQCFSQCGLECHLWADPSISTFDMFDSTMPEVFISHYKFITNDIIKYLSQNNKIETIINITGANPNELQSIEDICEQQNIKVPFVFTNLYSFMHNLKPKRVKLVDIIPAADIFLPSLPAPNFQIDLAILSTSKNDIIPTVTKNRSVYHLLSLGQENEEFDLAVDLKTMMGLYNKYKEIMLIDDVVLVSSQILFETSLKAHKVSVRVDKEQQPILDRVLAMLFHEQNEVEDMGEVVRQQILRKHTCFNRTARLSRFLKNEEASKQLQSMSEKL